MDGYMHNLDPYRQSSAGYYAPRYGLERRSSYGLPSADSLSSYARVPLDPYAGYGVPASYQSEVVLPQRYVPVPTSPVFRSRPRPIPKKNAPPQNLGPKKKPFKQTQKVRFTEEKERPFKKDAQRNPPQTAKRNDKPGSKATPVSQAASLAKETQELHKLFRTGVDTDTGMKPEGKKGEGNGAAKKRKSETQIQKATPTKEPESAKKQKGKKKKKPAKVEVVKVEPVLPTEEEMKEAEAALEMQRGLCKSVSQFLGIPETKDVAGVVESDTMDTENEAVKDTEKDNKEAEKPSKPEEPQRTPEEVKEIEAKSFKCFTNFFEEHPELRNLYIEKSNSGFFECLVCHSTDSAKSRKFWNLVSLVTHSKMTKLMQPEHSGYGRAVSAVLGWDHEKTPKVPRGNRPFKFAQKPADQEEEEKEKALDEDQKVADVNGAENQQEEKTPEDSSEDTNEE